MEEKQKRLDNVSRKTAECKRCALYKDATRSVPGEGDSDSQLMFIGEGPGFNEDQQGRPFVGQAGKLLDKLLTSISIERKSVFIGNIVKHRPPENRDPLPEEIEACCKFLDEQIEIIDPRIIVTLGRFSLNKFLPGEFISKTHGKARFVNFAGKRRIVIPMYHPAAALRNQAVMNQLTEDFKKILELMVSKKTETNNEIKEEENQLSLIN